ncbi:MAG: sigma-54 dependent transcriptional regulator [Acidobacteriaceae bacterium]
MQQSCLAVGDEPLSQDTQIALYGVTRVLTSVGRAFVCLDASFRIVHASYLLDDLLGEGAARTMAGRSVEDLLGAALIGPGTPLRQALLDNQKREGWRATLQFNGGVQRLVSITAAPILHGDLAVCDPRMTYVILLRPAEAEGIYSDAATFISNAIVCSPAMQRIFRMVEALQHSEAPVLITGESGVGKEVVARAIHESSPRSNGPFVAINCSAVPADLLESELFGHICGAFTGAVRDRVGRFELAAGGTLFLDEIGDMPPQQQVKLLRVLQGGQYERVGESVARVANVRVIAATNVDLRLALSQGKLREDLYYRLCVVPIEVPPLRQRREDIPPLAEHLLNRVTTMHGLIRRISPQAMRMLLDYHWPGNVRELANVMEYAVAVAKIETILPEDLPLEVRSAHPMSWQLAVERESRSEQESLSQTPVSQEIERLVAALQAHHWCRTETALALGLSRSTLWRRMRELHLADHPKV